MEESLKIFALWVMLSLTHPLAAQVKLPQIIRDSMVLQRGRVINIWGWASRGEKVSVKFNGKTYRTKASGAGRWLLNLPSMKAGGPYTMEIEGKNKIILHDILIGDVWFCSGQSNMVHQMKLHSVRYAGEIARAHYPEIRQFWIPTLTDLSGPRDDLPTGYWKPATPKDVLNFSAVAYFFAKDLYQKHHVPIGIINASVGGTPIEAWMSVDGFKDFPSILKTIQKNKDTAYINSISRRRTAYLSYMPRQVDKGLAGPTPWYSPSYIPKEWRRIGIPGYWEDQGIRNLNGIVWYRKQIDVPSSMTGKPAKVFLGRIIDADVLYINGRKVGNTTYQYPERRYRIAQDVLKPGKNLFVVRLTNNFGKGGFVPDKPYSLIAGGDTVDLKGYWQYKVGEIFKPHHGSGGPGFSVQNSPTALYNAMVAPVTHYTIRGFVWYQGASNTGHPAEYARLQPAMIADWRSQWKEHDIPFLYVQLPGYGDYNYLPSESRSAELREAQLQSLSVPNTAMAIIIDLGEWNDIHPDQKKPVGDRLALAAEKIAYGEDVVYSGPVYQSSAVEGNKIMISFTHVGSGLIFKDSSYSAPSPGEVEGAFSIAGADKQFVWAKAKIEGDKVVVWSSEVKDPKYVRYAWADDPVNPNLYNKEGLPASPFTTDTMQLPVTSPDSGISLKTHSSIPLGVAIGYSPMNYNTIYENIVSSDFDKVTFEYALKNGAIVKPDGKLDYSRADELVKVCREKGLNIYGHTLCWYQNNSPYMASLEGDSTAIEHFLKRYITTTVARYKNSIHGWDVVNEAVDSMGNLRIGGKQRSDYFYWGRYLGNGYIGRAFHYAHAADPGATLFYNDYNLETDSAKLSAVVRLVEKLKGKGVPIGGVGTQMHINVNTPAAGIDSAFRQLASTGLLIRISELDIKLNPADDPDFVITKGLLKRQADKCRQVLSAYVKYVPAGQRYGITFWNVGEKDSWIVRGSHHIDSPALFDGRYRPKPMYFAALDFFKKRRTAAAN